MAQPGKKKTVKFFAGFIILAALAVGANFIFGFYKKQRAEKEIDKIAEGFENFAKEERARQMADAYGGQTPEQTLQMYIEAVEKGDYELASKYFVLDKQEEWTNELKEIRAVNKIDSFLEPLKTALKSPGEYSVDKSTYSIHDPILVSFIKYPNGIWKIVEI